MHSNVNANAHLLFIAEMLRELFKMVNQDNNLWLAVKIGMAITETEKALQRETPD